MISLDLNLYAVQLNETNTRLESINMALVEELSQKESKIAKLQSSLKGESDIVNGLKQKLTMVKAQHTTSKLMSNKYGMFIINYIVYRNKKRLLTYVLSVMKLKTTYSYQRRRYSMHRV